MVACRRSGLPFTKKQIVRVRTRPSDLENLHHVEELAVDIANNSYGRSDVHHVALLHEELLRFGAYCLDDRLGKQLFLRQPRYTLVKVYGSCAESAYATGASVLMGRTRKTRHGGRCKIGAVSGGIDDKLRVLRPR